MKKQEINLYNMSEGNCLERPLLQRNSRGTVPTYWTWDFWTCSNAQSLFPDIFHELLNAPLAETEDECRIRLSRDIPLLVLLNDQSSVLDDADYASIMALPLDQRARAEALAIDNMQDARRLANVGIAQINSYRTMVMSGRIARQLAMARERAKMAAWLSSGDSMPAAILDELKADPFFIACDEGYVPGHVFMGIARRVLGGASMKNPRVRMDHEYALRTLKQGNMPLDHYCARFRQCLRVCLALGSAMSDEDLIAFFVYGLNVRLFEKYINGYAFNKSTIPSTIGAVMAHASIHLQNIIMVNPALSEVLNDFAVGHANCEPSSRSTVKTALPSREIKCQLCSRRNHIATSCFKLREGSFVGLLVGSLPPVRFSSGRKVKIPRITCTTNDLLSQASPSCIGDIAPPSAFALSQAEEVVEPIESSYDNFDKPSPKGEGTTEVAKSPLVCHKRVFDPLLLTKVSVSDAECESNLSARWQEASFNQCSVATGSEADTMTAPCTRLHNADALIVVGLSSAVEDMLHRRSNFSGEEALMCSMEYVSQYFAFFERFYSDSSRAVRWDCRTVKCYGAICYLHLLQCLTILSLFFPLPFPHFFLFFFTSISHSFHLSSGFLSHLSGLGVLFSFPVPKGGIWFETSGAGANCVAEKVETFRRFSSYVIAWCKGRFSSFVIAWCKETVFGANCAAEKVERFRRFLSSVIAWYKESVAVDSCEDLGAPFLVGVVSGSLGACLTTNSTVEVLHWTAQGTDICAYPSGEVFLKNFKRVNLSPFVVPMFRLRWPWPERTSDEAAIMPCGQFPALLVDLNDELLSKYAEAVFSLFGLFFPFFKGAWKLKPPLGSGDFVASSEDSLCGVYGWHMPPIFSRSSPLSPESVLWVLQRVLTQLTCEHWDSSKIIECVTPLGVVRIVLLTFCHSLVVCDDAAVRGRVAWHDHDYYFGSYCIDTWHSHSLKTSGAHGAETKWLLRCHNFIHAGISTTEMVCSCSNHADFAVLDSAYIQGSFFSSLSILSHPHCGHTLSVVSGLGDLEASPNVSASEAAETEYRLSCRVRGVASISPFAPVVSSRAGIAGMEIFSPFPAPLAQDNCLYTKDLFWFKGCKKTGFSFYYFFIIIILLLFLFFFILFFFFFSSSCIPFVSFCFYGWKIASIAFHASCCLRARRLPLELVMSALSTAVGGPPLLRQPLVTHFSYLFLLLAGKRCLRFPKGVLRGALGSSGKKKVIETRGNPNVTVGLFAVSRSVTSSVRWVCWVLFRL